MIDNIKYYSTVLRKWVATKDKNNSGKKRVFIFARDPRDISQVYFLDPDTSTYTPVPYFNNTRPAISLWELKASIKELAKQEYFKINEDMIFKGITKMRELEEEAVEKTRLARQQRATEKRKRRMVERRQHWKNIHPVDVSMGNPLTSLTEEDEDADISIEAFSDIQIEE